jgi:hypothetical protein
MSISPARQAFDASSSHRPRRRRSATLPLTDAATRLVRSTGANGNLFPILDGLAAYKMATRSKANFATRGHRTWPYFSNSS